MRQFIFGLCFLLPISSFSQKAYVAVCYSGKTQNIQVKFTLANGYIGACEIKTTDNTSKKTSKFLPSTGTADDNKKMKFDHSSTSGKTFTDYFILNGMEDSYDNAPAKITGQYFFNGKAFAITLMKQKKC